MCKDNSGKYSFSFMEMINSSSTGKTSATGVIGTISCIVMIFVFVALAIYFIGMKKHVAIEDIEIIRLKQDGILAIMNDCTVLFGMGSALLGVRNVAGMIGNKNKQENNNNNLTTLNS